MLIILSGSSGVGKNTIINKLLEDNENLELMTTMTTRDMRPGESQGNPYYFVTKEEFEKKIEDGEMLEHALVHGNYYGTSRKILEDKAKSGKILIKDIDVEGTLNLMKLLGDDVISIYLKPVSIEQLKERLIGRGETEIEKRLNRYEYEESLSHNYHYTIINDKMDETIDTIYKIMAEKGLR